MKSYSEVEWIDGRFRQDFIGTLFLNLGKYYGDYIKTTKDVPFWYSERTYVGHLAQSACRSKYYSIQDYDVAGQDVKKGKKSHYAPDLRIWMPKDRGNPDTCVFEVKTTVAIPISKDLDEYSNIVKGQLDVANQQIVDHGWYEGNYRCALVATPVYCAATKWGKYAKTPRIYHENVKNLRTNVVNSLRSTGANFAWTYFMKYEMVNELASKLKVNLPWIGIICIGKVMVYKSE